MKTVVSVFQGVCSWGTNLHSASSIATIGLLMEFAEGDSNWILTCREAGTLFLANHIDDEGKKRSVPLSVCGVRMSRDFSFKELVMLVQNHHCLKPSMTVQFQIPHPFRWLVSWQSWESYWSTVILEAYWIKMQMQMPLAASPSLGSLVILAFPQKLLYFI